MISNFLTVGQQVVVLFILIGVGLVCKKAKLISDKSIKSLTNIALYAATPCVIIVSFQNCKFTSDKLVNMLVMILSVAIIHIGSIVVCTLIFRNKDQAKKVVLRVGSIFSNCGFMSLPLQKAILGNDGVFYGAIYVAVFNIFIWTYGLVTMSGDKKELSLKKLITNPGIVGVVIAILLWVFHIQLPTILYSPIDYLGALNTPIPMIIIGCQLANTSLKSMFTDKYSYLCIGVRLVAIPLVSLFLLYLFGVRGNMLVATVIATSAPSAATTTMFATKYDRDVPLSVSLVSATTLASIVTMPTIVAISQMFA